MTRMTTCKVEGQFMSVDEALDARAFAENRGTEKPDFHCIECDQPKPPCKLFTQPWMTK